MREERQAEAMARINADAWEGQPLGHERAVPYCGCGARDGYTQNPETTEWVCARCHHPSKGWWEAQQKDHVTERMSQELTSMCAKYHKIKAKSDAQPKDQVLLNKKNTARGIIRGLATAISVWIDPHSDDLDQVMEIERTYLNA